MFKLFKNTRNNHRLQQKENRNRATLKYLRESGFSMPAIRKSLVILNEMSMSEIKPENISQPCVTRTLRSRDGKEMTAAVMERAAQKLGIEVKDLFPEVNP